MPIVSFLSGAILWFAGLFGYEVAKKTALIAASSVAMVALTAALIAAANLALTSCFSFAQAMAGVDSGVAAGMGLFVPPSAGCVIGLVLATKLARRVYDLHMATVRMIATA